MVVESRKETLSESKGEKLLLILQEILKKDV